MGYIKAEDLEILSEWSSSLIRANMAEEICGGIVIEELS